ncbi:hypothetical protein Tco_1316533 [Tanacetum coccineum]
MDITVVTLVEEQMSPWKGNLPKLPIESNIVRLATTSIVALEGTSLDLLLLLWKATIPFEGIPLFSVSKPCSACSRVFARDIYGDHAVSCAEIIGIKHRHNVVRDTLIDICYHYGISTGKEFDIGLDGRRDKPLRPEDMLFTCEMKDLMCVWIWLDLHL